MAGYDGFDLVAPAAGAPPANPGGMLAGVNPAALADMARQQTAPPPASYAGFERVEAPSPWETLARGAGAGATMGFGDELGLLDRGRQEAARRSNPWLYFLGEVGGTLLPAFAAAPVALGRLGTGLIARAAQTVARPFAAADMSTLPRAIGQGSKLGLSYGAVSGAGHADPRSDASWAEALRQRGAGALQGGLVGGAIGVPVGAITYPLTRAAQAVGGSRAAAQQETADAGAGALTAWSRAMERDRITPQQLIDNIVAELPTSTSKRLQDPLTRAQLVQRAQEGATQTELASEFGIARSTAARLLKDIADNDLSTVPLNLVDRSKLVRAGGGENVGWTLRAASATPGEARAIARERLAERQLGQGQRISDAIMRYVGTPNFEARSEALARQIATRNEALFDAAHQVDAQMIALGRSIGDVIQPTLDAAATRWAFQRGPVASAIGRAIEAFRPRSGNLADRPLSSLQEFMQAKQNLQALMDESVGNRTVMRELVRFKNDLYDVVGTHNPQWRIANDAAADGFAATRALNLGAEYANRLGPQSREQLARYRAMSEPEQELFRVGVAQNLHERIMNRQATHDLTSELRLPGTRQTLRTILGDRQADRLFARIDREFAATRTYREQFGSQTTPLKAAMDDISWAPRLESAWQMLSPGGIAKASGEWLARNVNERRNTQLLNMLTTASPAEQIALLRSLGPLHQARSTAGRWTSRTGAFVGAQALPVGLMDYLSDLRRQNARAFAR